MSTTSVAIRKDWMRSDAMTGEQLWRAYLTEAKYESIRMLRAPAFGLPMIALPVVLRSRNSSNTVIPRGIWTEFAITLGGFAEYRIHNLRPEQKLHKHTERPGDHDQLPSACTHP
jgi:hypothetical protein